MKRFTRRRFIHSGLAFGGVTFLGASFIPKLFSGAPLSGTPDIISISGADPMAAIPRLLEPLGGIGEFVPAGANVGLLVNSPWKEPGTYTHPDVVLAVIKHCLDAGAETISCFKPVRDGYWEESRYYDAMQNDIGRIKYGDERISVKVPKGVYLKEAEIYRLFLEVDVFINIPVAKHHNGTNFSGMLKGLMGVSSSGTNRHMHSPDGEYTYDKQEYLSQCIADLATLRQPDLCVMDAIECVTENGPRGPGNTVKPNRIFAGTDPVAMDALGTGLLGFSTLEVPSVEMAAKHGLGIIETDQLKRLDIED